MNIQTFTSAQQLYRAVALAIAKRLIEKPDFVLGLSAGKTPTMLYENLIALYRAKQISFAQVKTFNLDEFYGIEKSSPSSFDYYVQETFLKKLDIPSKNIHSLNGAAANWQKECADYEKQIQDAGGLDLQILGLGTNGHIAFNEPGSDAGTRTRLVTLNESSRAASQYLFPQAEVPSEGLTMGIGTILEAKEIFLLVLGAGKRQSLQNILSLNPSAEYPGSFLQNHSNVHGFFDQEAYKV